MSTIKWDRLASDMGDCPGEYEKGAPRHTRNERTCTCPGGVARAVTVNQCHECCLAWLLSHVAAKG